MKTMSLFLGLLLALGGTSFNGRTATWMEMVPLANRLPTYAVEVVTGIATRGKPREFLGVFSLDAVQGAHQKVDDGDIGAVALYDDINCRGPGDPALTATEDGAISCWAGNDLVNIYGNPQTAFGREINVTNYAKDFGDEDGQPARPSADGLNITAIGPHPGGRSYKVSAAIELGTFGEREFNRGLVARAGTMTRCFLCDYDSGADAILDGRGLHRVGIDLHAMRGGPAIEVENRNGLFARKATDKGAYELIVGSPDDRAVIGGFSTGIVLATPVVIEQLSTPSSSHAPCVAGQVGDDASFHYVCVSANKWKRSALQDF